MSLSSITEHAPGAGPSTAKWIGWTVAALIGWGIVYSQLVPFSDWVVASTRVDPNSHLGEAISFFAYDTPKVLMLLTLVEVNPRKRIFNGQCGIDAFSPTGSYGRFQETEPFWKLPSRYARELPG